MDKQLLKALDNLSFGLEALVEALKDKNAKSDTGNALQSGNFDKSLESITVELKSIKKDTQEILKNQQTIISLQKQKNSDKKTEAIEDASGPKKESQIKKGVSTILLIAVAVLAIGLAFKLVGKIDFLSVIALGAAIYVMSMAFEKVAKLNLSIKEAAITSATMVIMAIGITASSIVMSFIRPIGFGQALTGILIMGMFALSSNAISKMVRTFSEIGITNLIKAVVFLPIVMIAVSMGITLSSWILKSIMTISFGQALTAILIAGLFTVVSFGIKRMLGAFKGINMADLSKAVTYLPFVMPAIALGIAVSSWFLKLIIPISFTQALTGILIAAMFTVVSFGMERIIKSLDKVKPEDALLLTLILPAIALAITASSWIMSLIIPISFTQFLTALGIALLFGLMSYVMPELARGIDILNKALGTKGLLIMPLVFIAISIAIMLSSHILKLTADIKLQKILQIGLFGIALGIMTLAMLPSVLLVGMVAASGVGAGAIALGVLMIPLIAGAIAISSHILSMGKYDKYPGIMWALGVGLTMTGFGLAILGLGTIALTGIGLVAILAGVMLVPVIAKTIVATDKIISKGKYNKYPGWKWILSVGATMTGFGLAILGLGTIALTGIGLLAILAGINLVPKIAKTIVATDKVISKGKYDKYPGAGWAVSVGSLMTIFGLAVITLGSFILGSFGLGGLAIKAGAKGVKTIAQSIVDVAWIFNKNSSAFKKGPSKEWAEGVGIAISAFAPVYRMLVANSIMKIFGGGVGPKEFSTAIKTVSRGIVDAAGFFAKNKAAFINGPSKAWSEGVGMAIGAFAPVYKMLVDFPFTGGEKMSKAIITISKGIITAAKEFAKNKSPFKEGNYPSVKWGKGVGAALGAFAPVFKSLSEDTGWFTSGDDVINTMVNAIVKISKAIVRVANIFSYSKADWGSYPTKKWSYNIKTSIGSFVRLVKSLGNDEIQYGVIIGAVLRMKKVSRILSDGKFSLKIDPNYFKKVGKSILDFNNIVKKIAESEKKSKIGSSIFGNDPIVQVAKRMVMLANGYDRLAKSLMRLGTAMRMLNIKNLQQLGTVTKGLTSGGSMQSGVKTIRPETSRLFGKNEEGMPIKGGKKSLSFEDQKKNEIVYVSKQLEKVVKILESIDRSTSTIDEYIADATGNKIVAPPPITT